jgi:formyltetrahydrofolate deformylase
MSDIGRLLVRCEDRPGLIAAVSRFLSDTGANVVSLDQFATEQTGGTFMQRAVFHLPGLSAALPDFEAEFVATVASPFDMTYRLTEASKPKRVAILASREDHCLLDLLWRNRRGELDMNVAMVIANHADLADQVRPFGVPFICVPARKDIREQAETAMLDLLRGNVDFVVLARYMQILTPRFLDEVGVPVINIHHSFLPAFIGANPYRRAKDRGVKLVGATAHYVTEDLDEGPIIEQDVVRVDHRHSVEDLVRMGADVERAVLSRAVQWHCEDRIVRFGNQTVVF